MTAKIMLIVLGLGVTAMALLSQRQQRIDTAYEITRIHSRCDDIRTSLWDVRRAIAQEIVQLKPETPMDTLNRPEVVHHRSDEDSVNGG
ncbi:MAG: hypothetical protein CMJ40_09660 [Phycisphaerae bacterium]|nr:hypothetical protein [Phycisphaerae bacterium]|tara:strand:+ start:521 stop:787 length:267 start_codon:yes stop_codon:yes gene_type:complete